MLSKFLLPTIVDVSVYFIVNKFFPEKQKISEQDLLKNVRGYKGETDLVNLHQASFKNILKNRALKIALIKYFYYSWISVF